MECNKTHTRSTLDNHYDFIVGRHSVQINDELLTLNWKITGAQKMSITTQPPHQYPRRILVAVSGLSPQIITETLYGLAINSKPAWVPTEIHLITTQTGAHSATLNLLDKKTGHFYRLCQDYQLTDIEFSPQHIHVIRDKNGNELDDIRTPEQNDAAADFITHLISKLTQDNHSSVHVSIAGGRKTMGYYVGYALSLFGRTQDRLSHVLVSTGYENHPEFYYPTPDTRIIQTRENNPKPLDTAKATVSLAEIPFIRMRDDIADRLVKGTAGFSETINFARKAEQPPELIIDLNNKRLSASGETINLTDIQLAFYLWLLENTVKQQTALEKPRTGKPNKALAESFLTTYKQLVGEFRDIDKTEKALSEGMPSNFFSDKVNGINDKLKQALGKRLAHPYQIHKNKNRLSGEYFTHLTTKHIQYDTLSD